MTHYEKLLNCKTKEDFSQVLFELETDIFYRQMTKDISGLDLDEWLDEESDEAKTLVRGIAVLLGGDEDE